MKWGFLISIGVLAAFAIFVTLGAYLEEIEDCDEDRFMGT